MEANSLATALMHLRHFARTLGESLDLATLSLADSIGSALPELGRSGSLDILLAAYSLAATLWQVANPPEHLTDVYAEEPEVVPPEWNLDFASALTRLLTATCIGLISESS